MRKRVKKIMLCYTPTPTPEFGVWAEVTREDYTRTYCPSWASRRRLAVCALKLKVQPLLFLVPAGYIGWTAETGEGKMTKPLEQAKRLAKEHSHLADSDLDALWAIAYALIALAERFDKPASGLPRQESKKNE